MCIRKAHTGLHNRRITQRRNRCHVAVFNKRKHGFQRVSPHRCDDFSAAKAHLFARCGSVIHLPLAINGRDNHVVCLQDDVLMAYGLCQSIDQMLQSSYRRKHLFRSQSVAMAFLFFAFSDGTTNETAIVLL